MLVILAYSKSDLYSPEINRHFLGEETSFLDTTGKLRQQVRQFLLGWDNVSDQVCYQSLVVKGEDRDAEPRQAVGTGIDRFSVNLHKTFLA